MPLSGGLPRSATTAVVVGRVQGHTAGRPHELRIRVGLDLVLGSVEAERLLLDLPRAGRWRPVGRDGGRRPAGSVYLVRGWLAFSLTRRAAIIGGSTRWLARPERPTGPAASQTFANPPLPECRPGARSQLVGAPTLWPEAHGNQLEEHRSKYDRLPRRSMTGPKTTKRPAWKRGETGWVPRAAVVDGGNPSGAAKPQSDGSRDGGVRTYERYSSSMPRTSTPRSSWEGLPILGEAARRGRRDIDIITLASPSGADVSTSRGTAAPPPEHGRAAARHAAPWHSAAVALTGAGGTVPHRIRATGGVMTVPDHLCRSTSARSGVETTAEP